MVEISTGLSLGVILGVLVVTVLLSLLSPKGKAKTAINRLRRRLEDWQELQGSAAPSEQVTAAYTALVQAEQVVRALPEAYRRDLIEQRQTLREMLDDAHARQQASRTGAGRAS